MLIFSQGGSTRICYSCVSSGNNLGIWYFVDIRGNSYYGLFVRFVQCFSRVIHFFLSLPIPEKGEMELCFIKLLATTIKELIVSSLHQTYLKIVISFYLVLFDKNKQQFILKQKPNHSIKNTFFLSNNSNSNKT